MKNNANLYDYTVPMFVFTGFATLSFIVAYLLKVADKKNTAMGWRSRI